MKYSRYIPTVNAGGTRMEQVFYIRYFSDIQSIRQESRIEREA